MLLLSVVNFCLKKIVEMDGGQNLEVVSVINRNMYVDDFMKLIEIVIDVIVLVNKVCEQFSKGGFYLIKWCSNDRRVIVVILELERVKIVVNLEFEQFLI